MSDNNSTDNDNQPRGIEAVKNHMLENKIETALWVSRVLSIVFAIGYLLPIFGWVIEFIASNIDYFLARTTFINYSLRIHTFTFYIVNFSRNGRNALLYVFLNFIFQIFAKCILQSANFKCSNFGASIASKITSNSVHKGVFGTLVARGFMSLPFLLTHIPIRSTIHRSSVSRCFIRRTPLGQLLIKNAWCKYFMFSLRHSANTLESSPS